MITGPSGIGKSSLCLLLIDRGYTLVSDDQTMLQIADNGLQASAAPNIAGMMEIRNLGIIPIPHMAERAAVSLHIRLDPKAPRFIDSPDSQNLLGHSIPSFAIWPDLATAPLKVEYALRLYGKKD
ncbi:MAG: hypothetical protein AAGH53_08725 [Pseudomonadota bacterium]